MKRVRSITAATDFSRHAARAVQRAAHLASRHSARLELLHVVDASPLAQASAMLSSKRGGKADCIAHAREKMGSAVEAVRHVEPGTLKGRVQIGDVREEILRATTTADLLVLGARGQHPVRDALLGSTAERLLQTVNRPMLVVKTAPRRTYRNVVVPIDFSADSVAALEAAMQVAPEASFTFVHAYDVEFEGLLWRGSVPQSTIEGFRRNAQSTALARLHAIAHERGLPESRFGKVVIRGYAPRVILDAARRKGADLIAIGKQGRSLLGRLFIGSVTRHVLNESSCDVLVTRGRRS